MGKKIIKRLYDLILERKEHPVKDSYTCRLFKTGKDEILKKIGEEAIEVIVASKGQTRDRLISEIADLIYHTLVLMAEEGIKPEDVYAELESRFGESGLKAPSN
ncbi:phosphoribosyl-ATP pyrophosphatase [bacterium BMS3Abin07]|nr:phosphoribosyl-ATP pyrophosphatase [bacterium BMS3Abin07]GBE31386.1 phosphoribosyl-ATP pyrophosphatase [bacterium BMS3Bbin05]HDL19693.1 phosphoribosyl-ATP diphosphatase [Nitrospirota bacterium]HDO21351.1 phosphoribosyl-ATP diphosphatase [Nitrospirota bacterium]HDZ87365.1 phosphoribosyl-ATP diphosphatase [Nitrospirota bacterium]